MVVLVDEYDKVLSSNLNNKELEALRDVERGFFEVLKNNPDCLRLCFITGITRFSKLSIFSSMNNLTDISYDKNYVNFLGYTKEELLENFAEHIDGGRGALGISKEEYLERLEDFYDGYCFYPGTKRVYNPVSINSFFAEGGEKFKKYWSDTGGSKLVMDVAKKSQFDISKNLNIAVSEDFVSSVDIVQIAENSSEVDYFISLLFQAGYLTIKGSNKTGDLWYLDFPNKEISYSFFNGLLSLYLGFKGDVARSSVEILDFFEEGETAKAIDVLKSVYASVSYHMSILAAECVYQAVFLSYMLAFGAKVECERETNRGRVDAVLELKSQVYIMEFKLDKTADEALEQIKNKKYYELFLNTGKRLHLLAISFSSKERNIAEWKEELL